MSGSTPSCIIGSLTVTALRAATPTGAQPAGVHGLAGQVSPTVRSALGAQSPGGFRADRLLPRTASDSGTNTTVDLGAGVALEHIVRVSGQGDPADHLSVFVGPTGVMARIEG